jgi:hypothetical protein
MSGPSDAEPLGRQDDTIKKVAYLYAKGEPQKRIAGLLFAQPVDGLPAGRSSP